MTSVPKPDAFLIYLNAPQTNKLVCIVSERYREYQPELSRVDIKNITWKLTPSFHSPAGRDLDRDVCDLPAAKSIAAHGVPL